MQEFVPRSRVRIFRTNTPDPPYWTLNSCLVAFRSVWVHRGPFHNCMKLDAKWPKLVQLMQKFVPRSRVELLAKSTPNPTHRTLNSCFCPFHSVRVHFGLFCYSSKLGAKQAELVQLMQKFVPRSSIGITRNERTPSTRLDPKLMFCCVLLCLGVFEAILLL